MVVLVVVLEVVPVVVSVEDIDVKRSPLPHKLVESLKHKQNPMHRRPYYVYLISYVFYFVETIILRNRFCFLYTVIVHFIFAL